MSDDLRATVRDLMPALRSDLEDLVRIQSVSADPARTGEVWRSADAVADLFRAEGFAEVDIVSVDGGAPAVLGHKPGPRRSRTRLGHRHDDLHRADAVHLRDREVRQRLGGPLVGGLQLGAGQDAVAVGVGRARSRSGRRPPAASAGVSEPSASRSSAASSRPVAAFGSISRPEAEWA